MSSTPQEGEDGAREDAIDLPYDDDARPPNQDSGRALEDQARSVLVSDNDEGDLIPDPAEGQIGTAGPFKKAGTTSPKERSTDGQSSADDTLSIPDDTPSRQDSVVSSPRSDAFSTQTPASRRSPTGSRRPFDRRFQSRLSVSPLSTPRALSPAFLTAYSRQSSLGSIGVQGITEPDQSSPPWDVIRWTKLSKLTGQAFSEIGKRNFGRPTCIAVAANIVIGTTKGIVLIFDYQQIHKGIIGAGTKAVECGAVTSLAISADHTTVAAGHAEGHIFTWEVSRSARPFLHIAPLEKSQLHARKGDGHISGVAVLHVGFLGYRRTALVSADDRGMAFSHLATRGMGAVGRTVRTTRVLGRYPDIIDRASKPRKPSSVLAFSPLPLGNVEQGTDSLGLVAMMTPYLLVIVSTTPIAQTQHKAARPKELTAHGTMSGALAWFPAIKLKGQRTMASKIKLVYCWSNVLTVLEVTETEATGPVEKDKPPDLHFKARSRWKAEEAIVAVQWLSRSVLAILTITQQMLILEDGSMKVTDSFDLLPKHIYHADLYSEQLRTLVEQLDEEDTSMHGVVADAFHMSFRAYKGRLFLLGFNEVSIGSLSNWADRLLALMEAGDFIAAIRLATDYYTGEREKTTIGLPEDDTARQNVVREKLLEMISASLKYSFGRNEQAGNEQLDSPQLKDLADASIAACISLDVHEFLFEEVYPWYEDHDEASIFLDVLEPHILDGKVRSLPPTAVKALIDHFMTTHAASDLEDTICLLDTTTMDIDQVTNLCKKYNLYDAYIYVWNKAFADFSSPLEELLKMTTGVTQTNGNTDLALRNSNNAQKIFPYLSFILTGRIYPTGVDMTDEEAVRAKSQIYDFFFSGTYKTKSESNSISHQTAKAGPKTAPYAPFPHLHNVITFDSASFMSVMNEAFEDSYLNTSEGDNASRPDDGIQSAEKPKFINRQQILRVLLEIMTPANYGPEDTIFLDIFIARNLPKYPQYILLSGATLQQILVRLCQFPSEDMAEDCQLSVEYLLSVYHPPDAQSLIPILRKAKFYRVLKAIYSSESQYPQLISTFFLDPENQEEVFDSIRGCLREGSSLTAKQRGDVLDVIQEHAHHLILIDLHKSAETIEQVAPGIHEVFLRTIKDDSQTQFEYLGVLIEPQDQSAHPIRQGGFPTSMIEQYVRLMCQYNPLHVANYVDSLKVGDLHLDQMLPAMESGGIIDAAVILLARQGQVKDAMDRLVKHLETLEAALTGILESVDESPDVVNTNEAIHDLLESISKYSGVGIWLCQGQTKSAHRSRPVTRSPKRSGGTQPLSFEETLWLELMNAVVRVARNISPALAGDVRAAGPGGQEDKVLSSLRADIQRVFTALLQATASTREGASDRNDHSFLRILRAFLAHAAAASPSLSELRVVISTIFSAYAYEESLLALANSMLDKDLFVHVDAITKLRQRGWRPKGQVCEACKRRVWGPGSGDRIWEAWEVKEQVEAKRRQVYAKERKEDHGGESRGKGKATAAAAVAASELAGPQTRDEDVGKRDGMIDSGEMDPIVVFSCRHLYHKRCLGGARHGVAAPGGEDVRGRDTSLHEHLELRCPACS